MAVKPTESCPQLRRTGRASRRHGRKRVVEECRERRGALGPNVTDVWQRATLNRFDELDNGFAGQRMAACIGLVQDEAESPQVE